jgi:hypothetical protein
MAEKLVKDELIVSMARIQPKSEKEYSEGYFLLVTLGVMVVEDLATEAELVARICFNMCDAQIEISFVTKCYVFKIRSIKLSMTTNKSKHLVAGGIRINKCIMQNTCSRLCA